MKKITMKTKILTRRVFSSLRAAGAVPGLLRRLLLVCGAAFALLALPVQASAGSITIIKVAQPQDAQDFKFTPSVATIPFFFLDDDPSSTVPNSKTFDNLPAASYTFTETQVSGWTLASIVCTPSSGTTVNTTAGAASIALAAGANVSCTFTNKKTSNPPIKVVTPPPSGACLNSVVVSGMHYPNLTCGQSQSAFVQGLMTNYHLKSKCIAPNQLLGVTNATCQDAPIPGYPTGSVYQATACCGAVPPPSAPDLSVTKTCAVNGPQSVLCTVTIKNIGQVPSAAPLSLTDTPTAPAGSTYAGVSSSTGLPIVCTPLSGPVVPIACTANKSLQPGEAVDAIFSFRMPEPMCGSFNNKVTVTQGSNAATPLDPNPANNTNISSTTLSLGACGGKPGKLTVKKVVNNTLGVLTPSTFSVTANCGLPSGPMTLVVPANSPGGVSNAIAAGSNCSVNEPPPPPIPDVKACRGGSASWTTSYAPSPSVTITSLNESVVTVTNTLKCDDKPQGRLTVKKVVNNTLEVPTPSTFNMTANCTPSGPQNVALSVPSNSGVSLATPITAGSSCVVNEPPLAPIREVKACRGGSASWTTSYEPASVTIVANTVSTITVLNTLKCDEKTVPFAIRKRTGDQVIPGTYFFTVSCEGPNGNYGPSSVSVVLPSPGVSTVNVPVDSICRIVETPPTSGNWSLPSYSGSGLYVADGGNWEAKAGPITGSGGTVLVNNRPNKIDVPPADAFDPCCPPWNSTQLSSRLFYQGTTIGQPYTQKFLNTPPLDTQMTAYIAYVQSQYPSSSITINFGLWNLGTTGTGIAPGTLVAGPFPITWNGTGPGTPVPTFFPNGIMQVGTWYRVKTTITLAGVPANWLLEKCKESFVDVRFQAIAGLRPSGAEGAGLRVLQFRMPNGTIIERPVVGQN